MAADQRLKGDCRKHPNLTNTHTAPHRGAPCGSIYKGVRLFRILDFQFADDRMKDAAAFGVEREVDLL